jgi:hypothetical protein
VVKAESERDCVVRLVAVGECGGVSDRDVDVGIPGTGDGDHVGGKIDRGDVGAAIECGANERAGSGADIE